MVVTLKVLKGTNGNKIHVLANKEKMFDEFPWTIHDSLTTQIKTILYDVSTCIQHLLLKKDN